MQRTRLPGIMAKDRVSELIPQGFVAVTNINPKGIFQSLTHNAGTASVREGFIDE